MYLAVAQPSGCRAELQFGILDLCLKFP